MTMFFLPLSLTENEMKKLSSAFSDLDMSQMPKILCLSLSQPNWIVTIRVKMVRMQNLHS